jgi:hypothetical protein
MGWREVVGQRALPMIGSVAVAALLLAGCSNLKYQSTANDQAASVADSNLPKKIDAKLADLETGDASARAAQVQEWLEEPTSEGIEPPPLTRLSVGPRSGTTIPVVVYYRLRGTMLSDDAWGLACRDYVVGAGLEIIEKPCTEDTPETPYPTEAESD